MNRKIVAIAGALLLLGGGGGAYFFLGSTSKTKAGAAATKPLVSQAKPIFVPLAPLNVPLWHDQRVAGFFLVSLKLQVANQQAQAAVEGKMPLLRDAFLTGVNGAPGIQPLTDPDMLDFIALKSRLLSLANQVLGKGVVDRVLIVRAMRTLG